MRRLAILLLCFFAVGCDEGYDLVSDLIDAQLEKAKKKAEEEEEEEEEVLPPALYDFRIADRTDEFVPDLARILGRLFVIDARQELPGALGLRVERFEDFAEFESSPEFRMRGTLVGDVAEIVVERDGGIVLDGVILIDRKGDRHWEVTGKMRVTPGTCDLVFAIDEPFTVHFPEPTGLILGTVAGMGWSGAIEVEGRIGSSDASFRMAFDGTSAVRGSDLRVDGEPQEDFEAEVPTSSELVANLRPCLETFGGGACFSEIEHADGLVRIAVQLALEQVEMTIATDGAGGYLTDWILLDGIPVPGTLLFAP